MVQTYRTKSTQDFSSWFLFLRIVGNLMWVIYAAYISNLLMLINNSVSVFASAFVAYYKCVEIIRERGGHRYKRQVDLELPHSLDLSYTP